MFDGGQYQVLGEVDRLVFHGEHLFYGSLSLMADFGSNVLWEVSHLVAWP